EEEALFPPMRAVLPDAGVLLDELAREHVALRQGVTQLEAGTGLAKLVFDLGVLLERHIRKEERELFPLFETHAEALNAEAVGAALKDIRSEERRVGKE